LVRAQKGPSEIHGLGLIAQQFIPVGTTVWMFQPGFDLMIPDRLMLNLSETAREQVAHYAFYDVPARCWVLSSDDDRLTNHSGSPNTSEGPDGYSSVATRDIRPGEEITWNYGKDWRGGGRFDPATRGNAIIEEGTR